MMSDTSPEIHYQASASFVRILEVTGCSLAVSAYMSSSVVFIGAEGGQLHIRPCTFHRPMGLATRVADGAHQLAVATFQEIVVLADAPLLAPNLPDDSGRLQHLFLPRATLYSGDIDAHDLVWVGDAVFAANTRFSCISRIDGNFSFTPVWKPPFVSEIMPQDRCHLNGIATGEAGIAYVTALGCSDTPRGWNDNRLSGGLLLETPSGKPVLEGLCMPHSPRIFDGQLYVLESGTGRVLRVDATAGKAETLAELPGFARGLDHYGDILFVGLSRVRQREGAMLPIQEAYDTLVCGVAALDRKSGRQIGWLHFSNVHEEIFDVKVLATMQHCGMLNTNDERHGRALVLPGRAFWGTPVSADAADAH